MTIAINSYTRRSPFLQAEDNTSHLEDAAQERLIDLDDERVLLALALRRLRSPDPDERDDAREELAILLGLNT